MQDPVTCVNPASSSFSELCLPTSKVSFGTHHQDWDAIGRASPALLRLSPQGRTILSEVKRRGSANTTPFHGRERMAGAGTGAAGSTAAAVTDAERSRRAMAQALKVEEAQLLRAEERVLLQRRKVLSRALGSRIAPDLKQKNVFNS